MNLNVLIVDDSKTVRSVITKTLRVAGLPIGDLYEAEHGKQALEVLAEHAIDLMFTDINMPEMGGLELIDKLRESGRMASLAVVVVSTEGSVKRIREVMEKGVAAYVRKPFSPEQVRQVVEDVTRSVG
ncbi:MAG: response regulator [Planctomycetes bacterium]|nr:response regulator [Planctomycetota bacterium]MCB9868719.1 response regulator [Planctomycetota bacterium]MCB9889891.1 response regulator [Planctomycetota bacterium]